MNFLAYKVHVFSSQIRPQPLRDISCSKLLDSFDQILHIDYISITKEVRMGAIDGKQMLTHSNHPILDTSTTYVVMLKIINRFVCSSALNYCIYVIPLYMEFISTIILLPLKTYIELYSDEYSLLTDRKKNLFVCRFSTDSIC